MTASTSVDLNAKIPNNVGLAHDTKLRRALDKLVDQFGEFPCEQAAGDPDVMPNVPLVEYWMHTEVGEGAEAEVDSDAGVCGGAGPFWTNGLL